MLTVRCPTCKRNQKTQPRGPINKSAKRCVYCGTSFKLHINLQESRIVH